MTIDRKKVKKYFETTSKYAYYMALGGFLGLIILPTSFSLTLPLLIISGIGGYLIYDSKFNKPSDAQMDAWLQEDLDRLNPDSLKKAGIDRSELVRPPVMLYGPRIESVGGAEFNYQRGSDKVLRYSLVETTTIHFTEHQLITYQCAIDLITGNSLNVRVKRYFYKDVVSAETETKDYTYDEKNISKKFYDLNPEARRYIVNGKLQLNGSETFRLTTTAGTAVEIALNIPQFLDFRNSDIADRLADQAISAINKMLLSKKV